MYFHLCIFFNLSGQYRCGTAFYFYSALSYTHKLAISKAIGAPGHGKCIMDGINGNTKRKLTVAAGRTAKSLDDLDLQRDSKKFSVFSMINDKELSPSEECKRILELEGSSVGVQSIVKHEKREANRSVRKYHYWVRSPKENLSALKYDSPEKFTDENDGVLNMYHVYCCHQIGI